jgi:polar amino acid transport system substrate-binding protein
MSGWFRKFGIVTALFAAVGTTSAQAESLMDKIKAKGEVTVATEAALPPFEFVKDGEISGYGKDILTIVVKDMGVKLNQLNLPFQGILPGVLAGKFDFVATSVALRPERAGKYAFTMPIAFDTDDMMKLASNSAIKTVDDLRGKVVGTQLASSGEADAKAFDAKLKADGGKGFADLKLFTSYPEVYLALANGEIDGAVVGDTLVHDIMSKRPGIYDKVGAITPPIYTCWVTRPEDKDFRDFLNSEFKRLRDDGTLSALQMKWFGYKMDVPVTGYLPPGAI